MERTRVLAEATSDGTLGAPASSDAVVSGDGRFVLFADARNRMRRVTLPAGEVETLDGIECAGLLALSPDSSLLATADEHDFMRLWDVQRDLDEPKIDLRFEVPEQPVLQLFVADLLLARGEGRAHDGVRLVLDAPEGYTFVTSTLRLLHDRILRRQPRDGSAIPRADSGGNARSLHRRRFEGWPVANGES